MRESGLDGLEDGEPGTDVKAVPSWSYRALNPRHAEMFALLGLVPSADISVEAAAALAGTPVRDARTVLRGLEQSSLLTRGDADWYHAHDVVHAFAEDPARHGITEPARDAAWHRLAEFSTHTAHAARRRRKYFESICAGESHRSARYLRIGDSRWMNSAFDTSTSDR
ncbi:hypothetical protein [Saccharothrix variisporea]|uniref:hypothetical protein n=1 Tax=Saccharothrix variisporea TaxID=543527 RepID=UPI000EB4C573|nr:hypothetical protein [Saccharothrix variisporea]